MGFYNQPICHTGQRIDTGIHLVCALRLAEKKEVNSWAEEPDYRENGFQQQEEKVISAECFAHWDGFLFTAPKMMPPPEEVDLCAVYSTGWRQHKKTKKIMLQYLIDMRLPVNHLQLIELPLLCCGCCAADAVVCCTSPHAKTEGAVVKQVNPTQLRVETSSRFYLFSLSFISVSTKDLVLAKSH